MLLPWYSSFKIRIDLAQHQYPLYQGNGNGINLLETWKYWPLSLSFLSSQMVSSLTEQSRPSHVLSQRHTHSSFSMTHAPLPEQSAGQPASVQWRPFHPVMQMHVPFLHWPCSSHLKCKMKQNINHTTLICVHKIKEVICCKDTFC